MHEHTHVEINHKGPGNPGGTGHHYIDRINDLIRDLQHERGHAPDPSAARNLSIAIKSLEDALLRIAPPLDVYQPNPPKGTW